MEVRVAPVILHGIEERSEEKGSGSLEGVMREWDSKYRWLSVGSLPLGMVALLL